MLYLFTWNSEFLLKQEVKAWKERFISKYWEFNLIHIKDIESVDNNFLNTNITASSFLAEKKLIIIDLYKEKKKTDKDEKQWSEKEDFLLNILSNIAWENIVLINIINPDKRSKFFKQLSKIAELKEFNTKWDADIYSIINNKYNWKISSDAINTIIKYKSWNLSKIVSELEKLLISVDFIDTKYITENISAELEESIFQVIDDLLARKKYNSIQKIDTILNDTSIYAFYNNLIANIRTSMYIVTMKKLWIASNKISSTLNLWNRSFLAEKKYIISYLELKKLYIDLVNIDKKMKSWKLNWTEDSDFRFELEKVILS